jgi:hypothetical protein
MEMETVWREDEEWIGGYTSRARSPLGQLSVHAALMDRLASMLLDYLVGFLPGMRPSRTTPPTSPYWRVLQRPHGLLRRQVHHLRKIGIIWFANSVQL